MRSGHGGVEEGLADQVESLLEFVPARDQEAIRSSIASQTTRIAPTGYRRADNADFSLCHWGHLASVGAIIAESGRARREPLA